MIKNLFFVLLALFVVYEFAKITIFLNIAIGRVREEKKSKSGVKKLSSNVEEACYQMHVDESQIWLENQVMEQVCIEGYKGAKLVAHYIPAEHPKRIILALHGWRSSWSKDFSLCVKSFLEHDCSVMLVEQRAHGRSGGKYIGFGILERHDCKLWTEYINERFGSELPLYLYGVSMGASTILMASNLKLPENVKGIIADCGFTTPYRMMVRSHHILLNGGEYPHVPILNKLCKFFAGYSFKDYSTLEALKENKLPVLFIHGVKDRFVPYYMTLENYLMCKSRKELLLVEGADHCRSFYTQPDAYMEYIKQFFNWKDN